MEEKKTVRKSAGKTANKTMDKMANKTTGQITDKTADKTTGQITDKTANKMADEAAGEAANKMADEVADEAADKPNNKPVNKNLLPLYVLAIIRFFGTEEKPVSVPYIIDELEHIAENEENKGNASNAKVSKGSVYTCLRTLRKAFYGGPNSGYSEKARIPLTLPEFYGGTLHCYEEVTVKKGKTETKHYVEVDAMELLRVNGREELCYAFRGRL